MHRQPLYGLGTLRTEHLCSREGVQGESRQDHGESLLAAYRAPVGTNNNFILMHSVGSIPHGQEIDVPLNYADYYYLEALLRKRDLEQNAK